MSNQNNMGAGKIPPHSKDTEEVVLGQLLIDSEAYDLISDLACKELFYFEKNRLVFEAIEEIVGRNEEANMLTVMENLKNKRKLEAVGGPIFLSALTSKISTSKNIETYVRIITEKKIRRDGIKACMEYVSQFYDESNDVGDVLDKFQTSAMDAGDVMKSNNEISLGASIQQKLDSLKEDKPPEEYVTTKHEKLNDFIGGFGEGQLIIIAGRPSHGKSAVIVDVLEDIAKNGTPVGLFSLEMGHSEITDRRLAANTGINGLRIKYNNLSDSEKATLVKEGTKMKNLPFYIDDSPSLTINEFKSKVRRMVRKYGLKCVAVDYLQLMSSPKYDGNDNKMFGDISAKMKQLANELRIPVIALSQMSREIEKRPVSDRLGKLSDLRSSGNIEQDADTVLIVTNPELYGCTEIDNVTVQDQIVLRTAKCRHGKVGDILLRYTENKMTYFEDIDNNYQSLAEPEDDTTPF